MNAWWAEHPEDSHQEFRMAAQSSLYRYIHLGLLLIWYWCLVRVVSISLCIPLFPVSVG